jgi:hypothetical protein
MESNMEAIFYIKHVCSDWPTDRVVVPIPKELTIPVEQYCAQTAAKQILPDETPEEREKTISYIWRRMSDLEFRRRAAVERSDCATSIAPFES